MMCLSLILTYIAIKLFIYFLIRGHGRYSN